MVYLLKMKNVRVEIMEFYKQLSKFYDVIFPLNNQSVQFITERISKGAILDLAAGTGNHSIALAKLGYEVTATDLDENMVNKINEKARIEQVSINALVVAMEDIDRLNEQQYSSIICVGNSLVHLQSLAEVEKAIVQMQNLLEPNGKLIIQIVNYDRILKEGITELPFIQREKEDVSFRRTYTYEDNKIIFKGELTVGSETLVNEVSLLPLCSQDLLDIISAAGFMNIQAYGTFNSDPFHINSPAFIVEATKK